MKRNSYIWVYNEINRTCLKNSRSRSRAPLASGISHLVLKIDVLNKASRGLKTELTRKYVSISIRGTTQSRQRREPQMGFLVPVQVQQNGLNFVFMQLIRKMVLVFSVNRVDQQVRRFQHGGQAFGPQH